MTTSESLYEALQRAAERSDAEALLEQAAEHLRQHEREYELFEVRKLQVRLRLGLPLLAVDEDEQLDEPTLRALEDGLFAACREVGERLLARGKIRDGWMYLRPLGDRRAVAERLAAIEPHGEAVDELIEVLLHERVDPARGFQLLLERHGTCNAITAFQSALYRAPRHQRQEATDMLVRHVHDELAAGIRAHLERQATRPPAAGLCESWLDAFPWLLEGGMYHMDTTHLASTVALARELDAEEPLRLARDLAVYGSRLDPKLQYPQDPPFEETYPRHILWFDALLGRRVEQAVNYFRERAEACDVHHEGSTQVETYIDLLGRMGRWGEALDEAIRLIPAGVHTTGLAPSLVELAAAAGRFDRLLEIARQRDQLIGFALGLLGQQGITLTPRT